MGIVIERISNGYLVTEDVAGPEGLFQAAWAFSDSNGVLSFLKERLEEKATINQKKNSKPGEVL